MKNKSSFLLYPPIFIFLFGIIAIEVQAQKKDTVKVYDAWVKLNDSKSSIKGFLYEIKDSSLVILPKAKNSKPVELLAEKINVVKFRKKGNVLKGTLIGLASGFALGGIIGLASGGDTPCAPGSILCDLLSQTAEEKALLYGTLFSMPGALIGWIAGGGKIKIPISGKKEKLRESQEKMKKYLQNKY